MSKDLIPKIRFKGYTEAWEQRKLGDIAIFKQGMQVDLLNQYCENGNDRIRFIRIVDYTQNTDDIRYISKSIARDIITENDVVIVRYGATAGFVGHGIKGVLANNMFTVNPNNSVEKNYLYTYLKQDKMYKLLNNSNGSSAMPALNFGTVKNIDIEFPKNDEQLKISNIISNIDNLITLHQRKYDKLVELKKSLLEKMFPKNNQLYPEIRFNGFTEAWEQRKLGELISDTVDNRGRNPEYYSETGIPIIDNFMIKNNCYPDLSTATRYIDNELFETFIRKYCEVDDIIITLVGNGIGNIALFPNKKSVIIQNTIGLRFKDEKKFMYYSLLSKNDVITKLDRGMAQPSIRQDELKSIIIEYPSDEEKKKIQSILFSIDNLITLHQRKHEKLIKIKESLLNDMFV